MRSKFDEQLKKLNEEMMHMGSMIEESIQKAIEAFIHQDAENSCGIGIYAPFSINSKIICILITAKTMKSHRVK